MRGCYGFFRAHFRHNDVLHDPVLIDEDVGGEVVDRVGRTGERSIRIEQDVERDAVELGEVQRFGWLVAEADGKERQSLWPQRLIGRLDVGHLGPTRWTPGAPEVQPDWLTAEIAQVNDFALRADRHEVGSLVADFRQ